MPRETVLRWVHPDGKSRLRVERDANGRFCFYEERFLTVDESAEGGGIYDYWRPSPDSGLYPSALDAQNDAAKKFPWLDELLSRIANLPD